MQERLERLRAVPDEEKKPSFLPKLNRQLKEAEKRREQARVESEKVQKELNSLKKNKDLDSIR